MLCRDHHRLRLGRGRNRKTPFRNSDLQPGGSQYKRNEGVGRTTHESVRGIDVCDFIRHVQVLPVHTLKLPIKVDNPWFENNL
jgi:hypothetical protein